MSQEDVDDPAEATSTESDDPTRHIQFLQFHTDSYLIVPFWSTSTILGLVCAMVAAVFVSIGYECIKEYLRYVHHKAKSNPDSSQCCGVPVFSFRQKLALSCLHLIHIILGYFMMMCVMTMNIWLIIAVVVGATIGYGVGKPLIANIAKDTLAAHDYNITHAHILNHSRRAYQRSSSWNYQQISRSVRQPNRLERMLDTSDNQYKENERTKFLSAEVTSNESSEDVWVRRISFEDTGSRQHTSVSDNNKDPELPSCSQSPSLSSRSAPSPQTPSRFRSTSKVINDSFRSTSSGSLHKSDIIHIARQPSNRSEGASRGSNKHSRRTSSNASTKSSSRFKPVSREIMRQRTLPRDSDSE